MNRAKLIYTKRVVQTGKEISISINVLNEVGISKCYLWWD